MPWLSIIMFLLSFVLSKKSGRSTSASLLAGLAVGGATYALADPTNPDNLFKIGVDSAATTPGTTPPVIPVPTGSASGSSLGSAIGGAVTATGNVLSNLGPGTAAVLGGATGLVLGGSKNTLVLIALAVGAFLLLKD